MQDYEARVADKQEQLFGAIYRGASLSKICVPAGYSEAERQLGVWVGNPKGFLILLGPPGCGKTYICASMIEQIHEKCHYRAYTEHKLLSLLRGSMQEIDFIQHMEMLCDDYFLMLDDLGSSGSGSSTGWRKDVIFAFVDYRMERGTPTIITSNLTLQEIRMEYGPRTYSRLTAGSSTIVDMSHWPDLRKSHG